jgi:hypothetical protein
MGNFARNLAGICLGACALLSVVFTQTADAAPEVEINFDDVFEWKKPCAMTQELLESRIAKYETVPGSNLYWRMSNKEASLQHLFSPKFSTAYQPTYSFFNNPLKPNFVHIYWKEGYFIDRINVIYSAKENEAFPLQLLADMDAAFGSSHSFDPAFKSHEWKWENYSASAKYSTNVGKGSPSFLVIIRRIPQPGEAPPVVSLPPPTMKSSVPPAAPPPEKPATPAVTEIKINLDDFINWKAPLTVTLEQFKTSIRAFEELHGKKLRLSGEEPDYTYYFDKNYTWAGANYSMMDGHYHPSSLYFCWKNGVIHNIRVSFQSEGSSEINPLEALSHLDKYFANNHQFVQTGMYGWNWAGYEMLFYKYSNAESHCLEFKRNTGQSMATSPQPARPLASVVPKPEPKMPGSATAESRPPAPAPGPQTTAAFKLRLTQVNGLLISPLASGEESGHVTKMTLTALPSRGTKESWLEFNQEVGGSMRRCLNEVSKLSQLRHDVWPVGYSLQIGFEDKYIEKDGPSAAVACALLVESALTGKKWDPTFAVTGDLNADGSVQPIGGVRAKIRGATNGSCKMVAVPAKNERSVADLLLLDGPAPLVAITVFGIKTFDDAMALATTERTEALKLALADFEAMRTVMMRDPKQIMPLLRTPHASARLQALLFVAPECYSAKYLLLHAQGRTARTLSLGGSIEAAQGSAQAIVNSIDNDVTTAMSSLKPDEVGTSLNKLRSLRPMLDQRVWPYVDGVVDYGEVIRSAILNPVRSGARYVDLVSKAKKTAGAATAAFNTLMNNAQVREELGL